MSEDHLPEPEPQPEDLKAPLSFKIMIVMTVIYLGWRLVQGIMWLIDRIG